MVTLAGFTAASPELSVTVSLKETTPARWVRSVRTRSRKSAAARFASVIFVSPLDPSSDMLPDRSRTSITSTSRTGGVGARKS